ncbi:MAG: SDR family oxidoreductase [Corynebacterium sp.]|nr:SDR family oxidoreductase [Corynebacterium sp.]
MKNISLPRVLITGAAGGIGRALVREFQNAGYWVIATDAHRGNLSGENVEEHLLDLHDAVAIESFVTEIWAQGPLDVLVNAAGIFAGGPAAQTTIAQWDELFAINTRAVFQLSRLVGDKMAARGSGAITTVASNSAVLPRATMAAYGASKAAASIFTRSLGLELGPAGVRCNVVCPGTTKTPMIEGLGDEQQFIKGFPETFKTGIPLGRIAQPQDIAEVVVFVSSSKARHMTCQEIVVDGGASAR